MDISEFRNGVFALRTRRFGNVAEIMIKKLYALCDSNKLEYDKYDSNNNCRVEVKFSAVMHNSEKITEKNVIDQCLKANNIANRFMFSSDIDKYKFDCNIQQIKRVEFDILYYGLFFLDKIQIFKMSSSEILSCMGYSDKQHRNNKGEGQFHINNKTYDYHMKNFLLKEISYEDLYEILRAT